MNSSASTGLSDRNHVKTVPDTSANRIEALDFTKGALVLFMVLYHWLVYFHGPYGSIFRYLRFLPPSFIFITGFLISNAYLAKYRLTDPRLPKRLVIRGLKVMAVFVSLNLLICFLFIGFQTLNLANFFAVFVTGNVFVAGFGKAAAFYILVPISYLLLLSALLLIVCRFYKYTFYVVGILFLLGNFVLNLEGFKSANLELLTIGLLGLILGYTPIEKINSFLKHRYAIVVAYLCYTAAVTFWEPNDLLQMVGVCLTVMLIYMVGASISKPAGVRRRIILLGRYPLFGYIIQIALLQILRRSLHSIDLGTVPLGLTFVASVALTVMAVIAMDRVRATSLVVDQLYKGVFA
jgi:peptidoglycan/LPS O-acetylase OafA/YrhL